MRKTLLLFTVLLFGLQGWATTFTVDGVTYTITDATNKTVAIGTGISTAAISTSTAGAFTISSSVNYNGDAYAVTAIGDDAFYNCTVIGSVTIPNTVTSIGYRAFMDCSKLASIIIPSTVTLIKGDAFLDFNYPITVEDNNPNYSSLDGILYNKSKTTLIQCPCLKGQVTIPNTVTTIGADAFRGNWELTSITIPSSVTTIGNYAFYSSHNLSTVNIPNSVISIGAYAFHYCSKLVSVTIPSSVQSIGSSPFGGTPCLITVDDNNPNYSSLDGVLYNKAKTEVVNWPTSKKIFKLPNSVTTFANGSFVYSSFNSIIIPNGVTTLNGGAFVYCFATTLSIQNSVKSIVGAFGISSLAKIYVNNSNPANIILSYQPLQNVPTSTCTLYVPTGSKSLYMNAVQWKDFSNIIEEPLYNILISANMSTSGKSLGSGSYINGSGCALYAIPNPGYSFANWTENGNVVSADANYIFTVSSDRSLVANFTENNASDYTIHTSSDPNNAGNIIGTGRYSSGSSCTLTAVANTGYTFKNWTENDNVISSNSSYTFTVNASHVVKANFTANNYTISATPNSTTRGSVIGVGSYTYNTSCTLTATAKTGYVFSNWTENGTVVSTNPSYIFTVNLARTLVANFSIVAVAVTQPTATTLSGSIVVTPSTGFTYSLDGINYQSSNEFPYVSIGTYNVTLKNVSDGTVSSPVLAVVNASGLVTANNYQIKASNCTCRDTKDGAIDITLAKALDYTLYITGTNTDYKTAIMFSGTSYNLKNLPADTYKLVFKIDFLENYEQSFNVVVAQPEDLSVLKVGAEKSRATYALSGGTSYHVSVNDHTTDTQGDQVQVSLVPGENKIKIYTEKLCQGVYEETIYNSENGQISLFPNPTTGKITLGIPGEEESVTAEIISLSGALQLKQKLIVPKNRLVDIDVSYFISGTYIVKVNGATVNSSVKLMKK